MEGEDYPPYHAGPDTKVHGFRKHIVSNFLKDRHPYLESTSKQRYDPTEVFHAVFDRSIPKLIEILDNDQLPALNYREAFMLLNEMASHQENKLVMIDSGLVHICLDFLRHSEAEVRRESANLLGSLLSVRKGRESILETNQFPVISSLIIEDDLKCREVYGWMLCRMCSGRDGVEILIKLEIVKDIIRSFLKHSETKKKSEVMFLVYLLECSALILQTDEGIKYFVSSPTMKRFHELLASPDQTFDTYETKIRYLCLHCTSLISMNDDGKEVSISDNMIHVANKYLKHEDHDLVNAAVKVIMFSSIHLFGKRAATSSQNDEIIQNLISLLEHQSKDIVRNAEISIVNISDLPKGFQKICMYFAAHLAHLDKIFGPTAIVPLYSLLFRIDVPPFVTPENKDSALKYATAISYFVTSTKHKDEALNYAIEKTCKMVDRLTPLLLMHDSPENQVQIAKAITIICSDDEVNRLGFQNFVAKHGSLHNQTCNTKLIDEIAKYPELMEIFQMRQTEKSQGVAPSPSVKKSTPKQDEPQPGQFHFEEPTPKD